MPGPSAPEGAGSTPGTPETPEQRRRRLAAVFGETLPEQTSDDRDDREGPGSGEAAGDAWLRAQVPPHHGG
ncbi:hypothetical protein INN71_15625 [Nocardioides sp. ChNu-153]|uniref:hypothetical protein n=1 Tax=Nocardioides sp. ChNu-153 TaxID=2779364 RepID=UPI002653DD02|nr:hypothetical protein [Nocardioides sp. ChNu-153]MDN7122820.1 hypothetical protein [Nocardioides sp. ChNu-153]